MFQNINSRLDSSRHGIEVKTKFMFNAEIVKLGILEFFKDSKYTICCDKNGVTYNMYFEDEVDATMFILKYNGVVK